MKISADMKPEWSKHGDRDRVDFVLDENRCFVIVPDEAQSPQPWVWYAPTVTEVQPDTHNDWMFARLLSGGFAVCGIDVGESYGSPYGRGRYTAFHDYLVEHCGFSGKACLWAQSRGGLMHYNWAAEHPEYVKCIGATYPVSNVCSYPDLSKICEPYNRTEQDMRAHPDEHDPIHRLAPIASHRIPILQVHGNADDVVPFEPNAEAFARRCRELGGDIELIVVEGGMHDYDPAYLESQAFLDFFLSHRTEEM